MNPLIFRINEILAKIKKEKEKIDKINKFKEKVIIKLNQLIEEVQEDPQKFYDDDEKMDIMGRCHFLITDCNAKINKCNEKIKRLEEKVNKITKKR